MMDTKKKSKCEVFKILDAQKLKNLNHSTISLIDVWIEYQYIIKMYI